MCLVVLAWQQHAEFPLIVAGNRDEFHARPSKEAHWWPDTPDIVGGRDLQAAGTWFALHRNGRFGTVTNFRDAQLPSAKYRSRGHIVSDFLLSDRTPFDYLNDIEGTQYAGFNVLLSDGESLAWRSNRGDGARVLTPGIYGLSNALLDSPWPKVLRSKANLSTLIDNNNVNETQLLRLLDDRIKAPVDEVDSQDLPFEKARSISAPFIVMPDYGTRSSSAALLDKQGEWRFKERRFDPSGATVGESSFTIQRRE